MLNNIYDQRNIKVIVGSKPSIPKIKFTKEDSETCQIQFELFRTSTEAIEGIDYATVTLKYPSGRDSTFGMDDITVVGNIVTFTLPVSALYELGVVEGELQIYGQEFKRLTICDFKYTVLDVIIDSEYILNDDRYPVLTHLISIIQGAGDSENERIQNEIKRQENEAQRILDHEEMMAIFGQKITQFDGKIEEVDKTVLDNIAKIDKAIADMFKANAQSISDIEKIVSDKMALVDNKIVEVDKQVDIMWEDYEDLKGTITDENVLAALTLRVQDLEKNKSDINHKHDDIYSKLTHVHDDLYSKLNHNHDDVYSKINHNHDSKYSDIKHNHNELYSVLNHEHDNRYPLKPDYESLSAIVARIVSYLKIDEVPVGTIVFHSSENESGLDTSIWKVCNGQTLNKSDYPDLWTVIGSKKEYGNSGGSTFKLPDLVTGNRFIRVGSSGIGEQQADSLKSHTHSVSAYKGGNDVYGNWGMSNWQLGQETKLWTDSNGGDETRPINTRLRAYIKCKKRGGI